MQIVGRLLHSHALAPSHTLMYSLPLSCSLSLSCIPTIWRWWEPYNIFICNLLNNSWIIIQLKIGPLLIGLHTNMCLQLKCLAFSLTLMPSYTLAPSSSLKPSYTLQLLECSVVVETLTCILHAVLALHIIGMMGTCALSSSHIPLTSHLLMTPISLTFLKYGQDT